jgi:DUF4097 and DUF4098 domain-containing protein YvlB
MDEHISRILKMLEEGKITAQEAETLISALRAASPTAQSPPPPPPHAPHAPHAGHPGHPLPPGGGETRPEESKEGEGGTKSFEFSFGRRKGFAFDLGNLGKQISDAVRKIDPERIVREARSGMAREGRRWQVRMRAWGCFGEGEEGRPENTLGLPTVRTTEELTFDTAPDAAVDVENNRGAIAVIGGSDRVIVEIEKEAWAGTEEEAGARLRDLKVEAMSQQTPGIGASRLELRVTAPEDWHDGVVNLRLRVPESVTPRLRSIFGEVRVSDLAARVEAQTVSGPVTLENLRAPEHPEPPPVFVEGQAAEPLKSTGAGVRAWARVETISGDMRAVNIGGWLHLASKSGDVQAENLARGGEVVSVSGDVRVRGVEGESVEARSVSGDVSVEEAGRQAPMRIALESVSGDVRLAGARGSVALKTVSGDANAERLDAATLQCQTVSGDTRLAIESAFTGTLTANTVSGDVSLLLPGTSSFRFTLGTQSGDLHCYHAVHDENRTETLWSGTVGNGDGTITVQTRSGDVRLDMPE